MSDDRIILLDTLPCPNCRTPLPLYLRLGIAGMDGLDVTALADHYTAHLPAVSAAACAAETAANFLTNLDASGGMPGFLTMVAELAAMPSETVRLLNADIKRYGGLCGAALASGGGDA